MQIIRLGFLALAGMISLAACSDSGDQSATPKTQEQVKEIAAEGPDSYLKESISALRNNDISTVFKMMMPETEYQKAVSEWDTKREQPVSIKDAANFAAQMEKLTADGAEDALFAEASMMLDQMAPQIPMFIGMGTMSLQASVDQTEFDTDEEKQRAKKLITAMGEWAGKANFTDKDKAKKAIAILCSTARNLNMSTVEEFNTLTFDQALVKAGSAFGGLKNILGVYDLSVDQMLDSVKIDMLENDNDKAKMDIGFNVFGTQQNVIADVIRVDDRWFSADAIEKMNEASDQGNAE